MPKEEEREIIIEPIFYHRPTKPDPFNSLFETFVDIIKKYDANIPTYYRDIRK